MFLKGAQDIDFMINATMLRKSVFNSPILFVPWGLRGITATKTRRLKVATKASKNNL
jgi:hypothetical protein